MGGGVLEGEEKRTHLVWSHGIVGLVVPLAAPYTFTGVPMAQQDPLLGLPLPTRYTARHPILGHAHLIFIVA